MLLVAGTILSFISLLLVSSNIIFPIPFALFFFFSLKHFKDFRKSLFLTAIFALPYSVGKSLLKMDGSFFIVISPFVGIVLCLSVLSLKEKTKNLIIRPAVFIILFLIWGIISYLLFPIYPEVLDGIFRLSVTVLFFFLTRIYIQGKEMKRAVIFILISLLVFESCLTVTQFILGHPLGKFIEEGINLFPYGRLTSENITLYRPSGSMNEPTWMARFLTMILPFILIGFNNIIKINSKYRIGLVILALLAIFATFTRVSWVVTLILLLIIYMWRRPKIDLSVLKKPVIIFCSIIILFISIFRLFPLMENRIITSSRSFEEMGSFDTRIKLIQEAASLIIQYPLFGVGINRFIPMALEDDVTGFFRYQMVQVHNVFLIIASEMGIPAMIFFILFIMFAYYKYWNNINKIKDLENRKFTNIAAIGGLAYLLESQMGTIFLSPHLSLFILYMAIISE